MKKIEYEWRVYWQYKENHKSENIIRTSGRSRSKEIAKIEMNGFINDLKEINAKIEMYELSKNEW